MLQEGVYSEEEENSEIEMNSEETMTSEVASEEGVSLEAEESSGEEVIVSLTEEAPNLEEEREI